MAKKKGSATCIERNLNVPLSPRDAEALETLNDFYGLPASIIFKQAFELMADKVRRDSDYAITGEHQFPPEMGDFDLSKIRCKPKKKTGAIYTARRCQLAMARKDWENLEAVKVRSENLLGVRLPNTVVAREGLYLYQEKMLVQAGNRKKSGIPVRIGTPEGKVPIGA